jgi:ABC-type multidrug transport system permease subunit
MSAALRTNWRVFFVGGAIAYRALFNWVHPAIYIPTMLGSPFFQLLFFAYLGRFSGVQDDTFFVIGNAVQMSSMAGIYGSTMSIANERSFGTLAPLLATPTNRLVLFAGRALPYVANGLLVSAFGFLMGSLLLDLELAPGAIPLLIPTVIVTVISCTLFGMLLGSVGLRARDVFFIANLAYFMMLLFCGVNVPLEALPGWMETVGRSVPLTHGIIAARAIAEGAGFSDIGRALATEAALGALYGTAAYLLFRFFEFEGRRRASLETH